MNLVLLYQKEPFSFLQMAVVSISIPQHTLVSRLPHHHKYLLDISESTLASQPFLPPPALSSTQLPPPPTHSPANPAVSAVLTLLSVFLSRSPHFSLPLSISALLPRLSLSDPVCRSCSDYFSPSALLWTPPNAYSLSHNPNKNFSLSHTMELSQHQFIQYPHRYRIWPRPGTSPGSIPQSLLRSRRDSAKTCVNTQHILERSSAQWWNLS